MIDTNRIFAPTNSFAKMEPPHRGRIAMISTHGYVSAEPPLGMPDTGGQVVFVIELSKQLANLGFKVDIWTRQFEEQPEEEKIAEDVRLIRIPFGGSNFIPKEFLYKKLPEFTRRALAKIREENIEYDFINSHYWDAGLAGQSMAEALNTAHIHTPHSIGSWKRKKMNEDFPDDSEKFEKTYNFKERIRHEKALYSECDCLVATTPIQLDIFKADYDVPSEKLVMIPPGYDDSRFYPVSSASRELIRKQFGFEGKNVVVSIGRLSRNKGFDLLVDAFSVVAEHDNNAYLFMALGSEDDATTEDPMLAEIARKIKNLNLESRVTISRSLPDSAMADFYRAGDVFCLPSRYEPFGMTAIEAMACGTPSVITTNGGLYRTIEYGTDALFADPFIKEDFGFSIAKILKYPKIRKRLSTNGAHKTRGLFTWTGIAQQLVNAVEAKSRLSITTESALEI